ncbi:MAG: ATP-binding cassette domain-containing protein [Planctomycetota bacterium]|jgi:ABC-type multidrug transport system ATPase subunit
MNENVIRVENLVKYFDGRCVLDGINLKVPRGCIYGLLGRNAAGKTTIIRILLGLEPPTRGQTFLLGAESTNLSAKVHGQIGYVAEGHNLIQHYKVGRLVFQSSDRNLPAADGPEGKGIVHRYASEVEPVISNGDRA